MSTDPCMDSVQRMYYVCCWRFKYMRERGLRYDHECIFYFQFDGYFFLFFFRFAQLRFSVSDMKNKSFHF